MDWSGLRAKYRDEKLCSECKEQKPVDAFTPGRWKRTDDARVCRECRDMPTHCNHGTAWLATPGKKKVRLWRSTRAHNVCQTCEDAKFCDGCASRKPKGKFPKQCGRRSVRACGTVCVARRKPMACGRAVAAARKNHLRSLNWVLATPVSRTGNNIARTVGSRAWPKQSLSRQWRGWRPGKPN